MSKGDQLYCDRWKQTFDSEHAVGNTEVEIKFHTHEIYNAINQCYINQNKS